MIGDIDSFEKYNYYLELFIKVQHKGSKRLSKKSKDLKRCIVSYKYLYLCMQYF